MELSKNLDENIKFLTEHFGIGRSFDVVGKQIMAGDKRGFLLMIDGFAKDDMLLFITKRLQELERVSSKLEEHGLEGFITAYISYMEAEVCDDFEQLEEMVLSGAAALFFEGYESVIVIDVREYPVRSPDEPELEKVTRGPRDGFVETIVFNTALVRRRIREAGLRFELKTVGQYSKTNVALSYVEGLVDADYLNELREKIDNINVQSLVMAEKSLSDLLIERRWYNPLPQVRYTERPDVAAAHLLEGHILIIVDTTPSVIILPTTIFHFTQHAEDYYQNAVVGTYLRWIRFAAMWMSLLLVPVWLLLVNNPHILPEWLSFISPKETGKIPLLVQFLILEFGIDVLRLSSIHTPNSLTSSLGIIGGLILGDLAVTVGLFVPETVLYMAVVAIGSFATPSIEFAMAIRIFRLFLLILTGTLNFWGFFTALAIISCIVLTTKNSSKKSYLWPLIPFNPKALNHILFRAPTPSSRKSG